MNNFCGNHKIGILGPANSGKTVFLTSLIWHLSNHNQDLFKIGKKGEAQIQRFEIKKAKTNNFNFEKYKNTFAQEHRWPKKTQDFSIFECSYLRNDVTFKRDISFVDIPGERMSDILIWKSKTYKEWCQNLFEFYNNNPKFSKIMNEYENRVEKVSSTKAEAINELSRVYKEAMIKMLDNYCPVTPSTYALGTDGVMIPEDNNEALSRPIWDNGVLLPLPENWETDKPDVYRQIERTFYNYKNQVLKPLFDKINSCDNFIFFVDILDILECGYSSIIHKKEEFKAFINELSPSRFMTFFNRIIHSTPRIAYVAPKSDMVDKKDNFEALLRDFAKGILPYGMKYNTFVCSSCVSTERKEGLLSGKFSENGTETNFSPVPERWPDKVWEEKEYQFPKICPVIPAMEPPRQTNLNKIFDFVTEGIC